MLGVERYKVTLSPHDEDWARQFELTKNELESILADNMTEIHHVGSTAIKGIAAKPILDVAILINDLKTLNFAGMEAVGYDFCGEQEPDRYLFVKRQTAIFLPTMSTVIFIKQMTLKRLYCFASF